MKVSTTSTAGARTDLAPSRLGGWLQNLGRDLRHAARALRRRSGHTAVAALTMALGIGAVIVLFSITDAVLLKPLPWPEADRLVVLSETRQGGTNRVTGILTNATYLAWKEAPEIVEDLAAWTPERLTLDDGEPERLVLAAVTPSLFPLLRAVPKVGRLFDAGEDQESLVVLSESLWRERYDASDEVLGELVRLDGEAYRVIGVMPRDFAFPEPETRAWIPFHVPPVEVREGGGGSLSMFAALARLEPGASPEQAAAEGTARGRAAPDPGMVVMAAFGSTGAVEVAATSWLDSMTAEVRPAILLLMAAVSLLLLTAIANVASLQLAAASARRREVAVRAALGAHSRQLARHLLFENGLLGVLGGLGGLALATAILRAAPSLLPESFPRLEAVTMDLRVLLFAVVVSAAAVLLFGLAPLWYARRLDLRSVLGGSGGVADPSHRSLASPRALIMGGQVAIACMLLIGASLLGRSFFALLEADLGYDSRNVLTARLLMPEHAIAEEERTAILEQTLARLGAIEGVVEVAAANLLPLTRGEALMGFSMPTEDDPEARAHAAVRTVSPGYFGALGLRIRSGRALTEADTASSAPAAVVNQAFARRYLGEEPVGTILSLKVREDGPNYQVVGVAEDIRHRGATDEVVPELTLTYRQRDGGYGPSVAYLVARTESDPHDLAPLLRSIVREQDRAAVVESVSTMDERYWTSLAQPRLNATLLAGFALFALAIAAGGLFGLLSYSVAQKRREIGVRSALGATSGDVVRLVVLQGLRIAVPGLAVGLIASFWLVRGLSGLLYGTVPHDPSSFVLVPVLLIAVALLAFAIPARRAARIDAQEVLRST